MKRRLKPLIAWSAALIGVGLLSLRLLTPQKISGVMSAKAQATFIISLLDLFQKTVLTLPFWSALLLTLGLQKLAPAKPQQKIFGNGFTHDIVWFFYETVLQTLVIVTYVELLARLYGKYFSSLTISGIGRWPDWLRFVLAILVVDFLYWCQHVCHHKVSFLWRLHAVHHSQSELNFFTDFRYHILEYLVRHTFLVVPLLIVQINPPVIALGVIFLKWYTRFYHGNIKTDLGPLRYLLVTPQSHRVHHSIETRHGDRNFGAILSIWDFAFGTQWREYSIYPETGIADRNFPHQSSGSFGALLLSPIRQMIYPFRGTARTTTLSPPVIATREQPKLNATNS
ncbi:MAG: sterol desaturase family protein [Pyrinomonadaceae bacterium]